MRVVGLLRVNPSVQARKQKNLPAEEIARMKGRGGRGEGEGEQTI